VTAWLAPGVLVVLLLSVLLAVLLAIPVRVLQRLVPALPRGLAVLAALVLVLLLLTAVLFLVVPALLADLAGALQAAPSAGATLEQTVRQAVAPPSAGGWLPAETDAALSAFLRVALASALGAAESARASLSAAVAGVASAGFVAVSVFVIALYLVGDAPRLRASFLAAAPPRYRADAQELWGTMVRALTRMLVASLVSNTVQAALAYAGLRLLGVPLAGVLAAVTWLTAFVPIAGAWLGGVPAVLMALTVSPATALWTALLYVAVNFLDGNVLTPRLQGRALTVHPIVILVAVLAAGQLVGLAGILVMLPLLAVARVLAGFLARRLRVDPRARQRPGRARRPRAHGVSTS
jgi:predicted PurR-regulated permease PerM